MLQNKFILKVVGFLVIFLFIFFAFSCHRGAQQIKQYQMNPALAQTDAEICLKSLQQKQEIKSDNCHAVMIYGKALCESRQKEGALLFKNYDCHNDAQMLWMVYQGIH